MRVGCCGDAFVYLVLGLGSFLKLAFLHRVNSELFEAGDLSLLILHHAEPDRLEMSLKKAVSASLPLSDDVDSPTEESGCPSGPVP